MREGSGATVGGARGARGGDEDRLRWRWSPPCHIVTGVGVIGWDGATRLVVGGAAAVRLALGGEQSAWRHGSGAACNSLLWNRVGCCSIGAQGNEGVFDRAVPTHTNLPCRARHANPSPDGTTKPGPGCAPRERRRHTPSPRARQAGVARGGSGGGRRDHPGHDPGGRANPAPPAPPRRCRARGPACQRAAWPTGRRRGGPTTRHAGRGQSHGEAGASSGGGGGWGGGVAPRRGCGSNVVEAGVPPPAVATDR